MFGKLRTSSTNKLNVFGQRRVTTGTATKSSIVFMSRQYNNMHELALYHAQDLIYFDSELIVTKSVVWRGVKHQRNIFKQCVRSANASNGTRHTICVRNVEDSPKVATSIKKKCAVFERNVLCKKLRSASFQNERNIFRILPSRDDVMLHFCKTSSVHFGHTFLTPFQTQYTL